MTAATPSQYSQPKQMRLLGIDEKIIVDLFAGGGGYSKGVEVVLGRSPDIAINHNDNALSMHCVNHPQTRHFIADVWEVCPIQATNGRPVGLLHLSPDCTHFSQSKGGQARDRKIRTLSWVGYRWAGQVQPDIITLENVRQIQDWGPLIAKRDKDTGRVIKLDGTIAAKGERVPVNEQYLIPDPKRRGETWQRFITALERLGYTVETRILNAADYGAPTSRTRLFMVARRDGQPIVWPHPTHAEHPIRRLKPWLTAAECIDWSRPCPSIFARKKPLVDKTLRRIAKGIHKYVINTANGGEFALCTPRLVRMHGNDAEGNIEYPMPTRIAGAFLAQVNGEFNTNPGHSPRDPVSTITTTGSQQQVIMAQLEALQLADGRNTAPLPPIVYQTRETTNLSEEQLRGSDRVAAFLMQFYSEGGQWGCLHDPIGTVTTKDRFALITVTIREEPYVIVDIGLRMLTPRELYRAQGFTDDYVIDHGHDGRQFSKSKQVYMVGNSVPPTVAAALVGANAPQLAIQRTPYLKQVNVA